MPRPWKAYGLVRGLNAPPRRIVAPAAATASAVSNSWSRLSTEHGPAIIVSDPSPITASSTRMTVSSGWNSREVSLNGRLSAVTDATPGRRPKRSRRAGRRVPISPTTAMTVCPSPSVVERGHALGQDLALDAEDLGLAGAGGHHDQHRVAVSSAVARHKTKKQRSGLCFVCPARPVPRGLSDREASCRASKVEVVVHVRARTVSTGALDVNAGGPVSRRPSPARPWPARRSPRRPRSWHRRSPGRRPSRGLPARAWSPRTAAVVFVGPEAVAEREHPVDLGRAGREDVQVDGRVGALEQPVLEPVRLADPQDVAGRFEVRDIRRLVGGVGHRQRRCR